MSTATERYQENAVQKVLSHTAELTHRNYGDIFPVIQNGVQNLTDILVGTPDLSGTMGAYELLNAIVHDWDFMIVAIFDPHHKVHILTLPEVYDGDQPVRLGRLTGISSELRVYNVDLKLDAIRDIRRQAGELPGVYTIRKNIGPSRTDNPLIINTWNADLTRGAVMTAAYNDILENVIYENR